MTPTVRFTSRSLCDLKRLDPPTRARILEGIDRYVATPPARAVRLKGGGDTFRIRVGDWRVLFAYHAADHIVEIQRVAHRSQAYR